MILVLLLVCFLLVCECNLNNNRSDDSNKFFNNTVDVKDYLRVNGYVIDKTKEAHSGSFNIVKYYTNQTQAVVLRESIEVIQDIYRDTFINEIKYTSLMSDLQVSPKLIMSGFTYDYKGFMISETYDYSLGELSHKKLFFRYKVEIRRQLNTLLDLMIYNASFYNTDMKIENIVVKINEKSIDIRFIDFDPWYCKTTFDEMSKNKKKIENHIDRLKIYKKAWKVLCCIFIEDHFRSYTSVSLLKVEIEQYILDVQFTETYLLAMSDIYESYIMESIREHYYKNFNLYTLITNNVFSIEMISDKIKILLK